MPKSSSLGYARGSRITATVPQGTREVSIGGTVLGIARGAGWVRCELDDGTIRRLPLGKVGAER